MTNNVVVVKGKNDEIIILAESVGSNIKRLRKYTDKTQEALAEEARIELRRLRRIENEGLTPTIEEMKEICKSLQVSVLALFFKVRINEIVCDNRTGLNVNTIQWLARLNFDNHSFINMLNFLAKRPNIFKLVNNGIKGIIKGLK